MPNRKQRRANDKKFNRKKYSLTEVQKAISIAIEMKKISKGHLFSKNLKDRCVFCGQTMKTKKECEYWFMTFLDRLQTVVINPTFFRDDEIQALWLQQGEEYQNIQLPLNVGNSGEPKN